MKKNIIVKKNSVTYQIPPAKRSIYGERSAQDRDSSFGNGEQ